VTPLSYNWGVPLHIYAMDDTVEKSSFYDTSSPVPDLEGQHPRQPNFDQDEQPSQTRIRHRTLKEKEDNNDSIMEYGEEQDVRALYQPMCG
jgi:hypothetical protein